MKFRKKPVIIDALQLEYSHAGIKRVLEFMGQTVRTKTAIESDKFHEYCQIVRNEGMTIHTLEDGKDKRAKHVAEFGDWIIKGIRGEFYPCKPDIFEKTYELVED